jgi:hypothetical protein
MGSELSDYMIVITSNACFNVYNIIPMYQTVISNFIHDIRYDVRYVIMNDLTYAMF